MKRISIRARVTLWYTGLLVVLLGLGVVYLLSFSDQMLLRQTRDALLDVVSDAVKQAHFDDGELDDEKIDFYSEGVSVFFYDTSGRLLAPRVNRGLQVDSILEDQAVKTVSNGRETWMVHDLFAIQDGTGFWVRGVVSLSGSTATVHGMILLALIGVPIFIAVAALGGWLITRRAFFPVGKMAETAQAISSGSDLSLRVPDDGSGDELSRLGCTINSMLARLQASFETERQFSSDASHELRTPTAVIISQCEYALSDAVDEAERRESLGVVLRQARRMSAIISQLLLLARAENGKFEPSWERLNLSELCEMVLLEMEDTAQSQGIALEMQLEPDIMLTGDQTLLMRLLTNLIINAIRYNRKGGRVEVCLRRMETGAVLRVADTGVGIREEDLPKIWSRFFRADASRSSTGTGLGLSMARWIAQVHGGTITVESVYGQGSVFTVTIPFEQKDKLL